MPTFPFRNSVMLLRWLRFSYSRIFCQSFETIGSQHFGDRNTFTVFISFVATHQKENRKPKFIDCTLVRGRLFLNDMYCTKNNLAYCRKMKFGSNVTLKKLTSETMLDFKSSAANQPRTALF
jgi:hypothetical protein